MYLQIFLIFLILLFLSLSSVAQSFDFKRSLCSFPLLAFNFPTLNNPVFSVNFVTSLPTLCFTAFKNMLNSMSPSTVPVGLHW